MTNEHDMLLGELKTSVKGLRDDHQEVCRKIDALKDGVEKNRTEIISINRSISLARGGLKMLIWIGSVVAALSATLGGLISKLLHGSGA